MKGLVCIDVDGTLFDDDGKPLYDERILGDLLYRYYTTDNIVVLWLQHGEEHARDALDRLPEVIRKHIHLVLCKPTVLIDDEPLSEILSYAEHHKPSFLRPEE